MATYTNEYRTPCFPESVMDSGKYEDISDDTKAIIDEIELYKESGNTSMVAMLQLQYASILEKISIGAKTINSIIEEIRNTQIYAKQTIQQIVLGATTPEVLYNGLIWIETEEE